MSNKASIILVNYNNCKDTLECLDSVLLINYPNFDIIIVDNGSTDDSWSVFTEYANKSLENNHEVLCSLLDENLHHINEVHEVKLPKVIFIKSDKNLGFAGGNNLGLAYARQQKGFQYAWFLNNDTVVEPNALRYLIEKIKIDTTIGIVGSKLYYYDKPAVLQGIGGKINKLFGRIIHVGINEVDEGQYNGKAAEIDYVIGASMLVCKTFLKDVGPMSEEYFLYFEELDWATRAKKAGYKLAYAPQSIVYHKEGATIGRNPKTNIRSMQSEGYLIKNRILFYSNHFPAYLPGVYLGFLVDLFRYLRNFQFKYIYNLLLIITRIKHPKEL